VFEGINRWLSLSCLPSYFLDLFIPGLNIPQMAGSGSGHWLTLAAATRFFWRPDY
jgi:hypothetical protein